MTWLNKEKNQFLAGLEIHRKDIWNRDTLRKEVFYCIQKQLNAVRFDIAESETHD